MTENIANQNIAKNKIKKPQIYQEALRKCNNFYTKLTQRITMLHLAILSGAAFLISILPELYLTTVNRAAGDDHGYGSLTHAAWVASHSLWEVFKAAGRTIIEYYESWQGTWFSIFLFTLQPEVFHESAYVFVTAGTLAVWILCTSLLLYELLVKTVGFSKSGFIVTDALFLLIGMQFVPGRQASMFWYNGIIHYTLPFNMCLLLGFLLIRYVKTLKWGYWAGITVLLALLGGSNYQSALFALIISVLFMAAAYGRTGKKRFGALLFPILLLIVGLIISMKAPGNKVRGGADFGFSVVKAIQTIVRAFGRGIRFFGTIADEQPLLLVGLVLMLVIVIYAVSHTRGGI